MVAFRNNINSFYSKRFEEEVLNRAIYKIKNSVAYMEENKAINDNSHLIERIKEIKPEWFVKTEERFSYLFTTYCLYKWIDIYWDDEEERYVQVCDADLSPLTKCMAIINKNDPYVLAQMVDDNGIAATISEEDLNNFDSYTIKLTRKDGKVIIYIITKPSSIKVMVDGIRYSNEEVIEELLTRFEYELYSTLKYAFIDN